MKCIICGQSNVDGADNQYGEFVCLDCWADGSAEYEGYIAVSASPVPGYNYSGVNSQGYLDALNHKTKREE